MTVNNISFLRRRGYGFNTITGIVEQMKHNANIIINKEAEIPHDTDLLIRFGCRGSLPSELKERRPIILNKAAGIKRVTDKFGFRRHLQERGLGNITPLTMSLEQCIIDMPGPCVVRPSTHHKGRGFHVCYTLLELLQACKAVNNNGYAQEYINKEKEFRVNIMQNRVVSMTEKVPKDTMKPCWNNDADVELVNVRWGSWDLDVANVALKVFSESGLDFGGVDVIIGHDERVLCLEVNSCPALSSYRQQSFAKVLDWMIDNSCYELPNVEHCSNWKDVIHPALLEKR